MVPIDDHEIPGFLPPGLGEDMARFTFDYFTAADGRRLRYGVFEAEKPSGKFCVLLTGQTEFIEKYLEVIRELNGRGFAVATFDWRGQGASQRPLAEPLKCHVGDFSEFDRDLESFMAAVVKPRTQARPLMLAHSMGSHLGLRALHDHPGMFRAAVLVAPMQAIATRGYPGWLTRIITAVQNWRGKAGAFAWGMEKHDPLTVDFARQLCTSNEARFARTQAVIKAHPFLRVSGPTWGWVEAAYRSMRPMEKSGYAEAIQAPVLVIGAGKDRIVKTEATRKFAARLSKGRYVEFEDAEHEILMERDDIRARFWAEFDRFTTAL